MVSLSNDTSYENYLTLRRQLGEQENGDISGATWRAMWPFEQKTRITEMVKSCHALLAGRDISWDAYRATWKTNGSTVTYPTREAWDAVPLFIKAAIIKPKVISQAAWDASDAGLSDFSDLPGKLFSQRQKDLDRPDTEVVAW